MIKKSGVLLAVLLLATAYQVKADVSVAWTAPPNGSMYAVGSSVTPVGQASASGVVGGTGLDLALVIDTSGSMSGSGITAAKNASIALVNALPMASSSVTVIQFDSSAGVVKQLTGLLSDKVGIISAINSLSVGGVTAIGSGIQVAAAELTSVRHTAGRSQQMVVLSDGYWNSGVSPYTAAANAIAGGVDQIHTVGTPGHDASLMRGIADGPDGTYGNSDDYGVYTTGSLDQLEGLFSGTTGNLVGIDHVDLEDPDGNVYADVVLDGLGNFSAPTWAIKPGSQTWKATAYDTEGNSQSAFLTLRGQTSKVPDCGGTLTMLIVGLAAVGGISSRRK